MLTQDLGHGLRQLARNTGFTADAALRLGLGVGANTSIFSLFDGFLPRSLPVEDSGQLVGMYAMRQGQYVLPSYPDCLDLRRQDNALSGVTALPKHWAPLNIDGETEMVKRTGFRKTVTWERATRS